MRLRSHAMFANTCFNFFCFYLKRVYNVKILVSQDEL